MSVNPLVQRLIDAVGSSPAVERIAELQTTFYGPVVERVVRGPLHTDALGHSLHPPLTDVAAGCWLGASLLDLTGGPQSRRAATLLTGAGVVAAIPTALAGAADWWHLTGKDRRIGAAHGLGMDVAIALFTGSLIARSRDAQRLGAGLALAGNAVVAGAALLGGHLALSRGAADRTS